MIPYRILPQYALIIACHQGRADLERCVGFADTIHSDPDYNPEFDLLVELVGASFAYTTAEIHRIASVPPIAKRVAFVAAKDLSFGMCRMYASIMESEWGKIMQVFREKDAALAWLGKSSEELADSLDELRGVLAET